MHREQLSQKQAEWSPFNQAKQESRRGRGKPKHAIQKKSMQLFTCAEKRGEEGFFQKRKGGKKYKEKLD